MVKFTHVLPGIIPEHIKAALMEQPARSGMYNWIFAFKGEVNAWREIKDRVDDFDIIQVNMSPIDMDLIPEIRRKLKGSSTKLVINNDYVCEKWDNWKLHPWKYDQIQRNGDVVFGTEPYQVSNMIDGAFCIPHPTNTEVLKRVGFDKSQKQNSAGFVYHWWDGQMYTPSRTLNKAKELLGIDKTRMYGYKDSSQSKMGRYRDLMFDETVPLLQFPEFIDVVQREKFMFDPNLNHTYGRNGTEFACVGLPVIGSDRVFSYNKLFPNLCCDPCDSNANIKLMEKVMTGDIDDDMKFAYKEVEYFNYKNSKKRMTEALQISEDRGRFKWNF